MKNPLPHEPIPLCLLGAHIGYGPGLRRERVQRCQGEKKSLPLVLGGQSQNKGYAFRFGQLDGYPETRISPAAPVFEFDRSYIFGEGNKHSDMIVADWVKAAHTTQSGDMYQSMHRGDLEPFWYFALNGEERIAEVQRLFEALKAAGFPTSEVFLTGSIHWKAVANCHDWMAQVTLR